MAPGVSGCHYREVPLSISFSGSGFMATYQLGVAQCFLNYAPWILRAAPCVLGASAGSLVAAAVVCEISLITMRDEMIHFAKQMKAFTLGPFNPSVNVFHWLESILHKHLPFNAHQLASGRLAVATTRMTDSKLIIMSEFQSKEDVVQALLCSCFVPGYCGMLPPSFRGVHYVDGGFSSMQPVLPAPCSHILTVSPFSGETDICPADTPCMWDMVVSGTTLKGNMANSFRIINALYPMALETLEQAYDSGYKDAIHFLLNNGLAPYLMIHKVSQGPLNHNQTKTWMHVETTIEDEEEMKAENETATLTSSIDNRSMQTGSSTDHEWSGNRPIKEPPLHFDMTKNVLLGNVVTYLSMFGLTVRILSHLLLPLMLSFYAVLQSRHSIVVCSLKKNIEDRVMPFILLLLWLKIQAQYEATQGQRHATPCHKFSSSAHSEDVKHRSLHRWFITPSWDHKKTKLQHIIQ
ncbi:patatin-like phospholipase domain-containing protein 2 isoform X2 [Siniperca chuatsi]|uniref:patatin-like phospholipase domain-containing protein 2 isoform X2 n=1 Tax=Siniperca chuatsi TaxID=119488 RepID=UPI001CE0E55E|nr:patatin-like phospholipase domain-containing protein 2 isoform X2 [Siniperca chuatsi]